MTNHQRQSSDTDYAGLGRAGFLGFRVYIVTLTPLYISLYILIVIELIEATETVNDPCSSF